MHETTSLSSKLSIPLATVLLLTLLVTEFAFSSEGDTATYTRVSAIELLASGSQFDGWRVTVRGILSVARDDAGYGMMLFVSREHYLLSDTSSALSLVFSEKIRASQLARIIEASGRPVDVAGTFRFRGRERSEPGRVFIGPHSAPGTISDVVAWWIVDLDSE